MLWKVSLAVTLAFFLSFVSASSSVEIYEYRRAKRGAAGKLEYCRGCQQTSCLRKKGPVNLGFNITFTPVSVFSVSTLVLNIPQSPCINTWTLYIITCEHEDEVDAGGFEGFLNHRDLDRRNCRLSNTTEFQNVRRLSLEYDFKADGCYWFHLNPTSCDLECSIDRNNIFFTRAGGCSPEPDPPKLDRLEKRVKVWYFMVTGIALALAGIVCAILTMNCRRKTALSQGGSDTYSSVLLEREISVLFLYRREDETHQARVLGTMRQLRDQLGFQIFDLYEGNSEMRSDPHGWILKAMSLGSPLKVVLVNSPEVIRLQRSFLHQGQVTRMDYRSDNIDEQTNAFLLALKRLHERDLVYDYKRVFVVSWDNSIKNDLKLLVEARRYHLPDHFPSLLTDLSSASIS